MTIRHALTCFLFGFVLASDSARGDVVSPDHAAAWAEDLRFVRERMPDVHPDLFHAMTRDAFDASIDTLIARTPSMSHHELIVELAAIVAAVGDGHTRLTLPIVDGSGFFTGHSPTPPPAFPAMRFRYLPVRLAAFADGLFVHEIGREHAGDLGARVEGIGGVPIDEVVTRVSRVVHHDNDHQRRALLPSRLVLPELLHALGIVEDPGHVRLALSSADGDRHTVVLSPVPEGTAAEWVSASSLSGVSPLRDGHPDRNFWFEVLDEPNVVYGQYDEVYDEEDETIAAFATRLTGVVESTKAAALVLDLRFNRGGDNSLNRSFLHALIRCRALDPPGRLFVLIGRNTFSAAMMFALDLETHTSAIFVGEPTGARPNHFGDSRKIRLPNTGLTLRVSTLYWQYAGPKDSRESLEPHIPAIETSADGRAGRDAALEAVLALLSAANGRSPAGRWTGRVLDYDIGVELGQMDEEWTGTIDFPGEGVAGLPLTNVHCHGSSIRFDFPNGEEMIAFEATIRGETLVGSVSESGRVHPWVMIPSE